MRPPERLVSPTDAAQRDPPAVARLLFGLYRHGISPVLHTLSPTRCRFLPTCSEYAWVAVARFGVVRGSWLALRRLGRCHPFSRGGLDPVPEQLPKQNRGS